MWTLLAGHWRPERLGLKVLVALMDILDCTMEDLIEPIAAGRPERKARTASGEGGRRRAVALRGQDHQRRRIGAGMPTAMP
jgi:hypothetical protein